MPTFVDSNVIVYAKDSSDPVKQERAEAWITHLWRTGAGRVSTQVLQEAYVVMTRKLAGSAEDHRSDIADLFSWRPLVIGTDTIESAWALQDRCSVSFWDALILSAAHQLDCATLLSEDLTHGETYGEVHTVNPFLQPPPD